MRAGKVTASRLSDVLSDPKTAGYRNYVLDLALERINGYPFSDKHVTLAMRQGTAREPDARALYEVQTGTVVTQVPFIEHSYLPMVGCSPDGLVEEDGGLEAKSPERAAHYRYLTYDKCPAEYLAQVQGSLWITKRKWWDFVSYSPDFPDRQQLKIIRVYPDKEYMTRLDKTVVGFLAEVKLMMDNIEKMIGDQND